MKNNVAVDNFYLFTYVNGDQIDHDISKVSTSNPEEFKKAISNWSKFSGTIELTLDALKHAMKRVNKNAFVCIWTDEIGDNKDEWLHNEILRLKASTKSEIFFMVVTKPVLENQRRYVDKIEEYQNKFGSFGHVMDIVNDPNVISEVMKIMKDSAICDG